MNIRSWRIHIGVDIWDGLCGEVIDGLSPLLQTFSI
jgi:hypothetical protein